MNQKHQMNSRGKHEKSIFLRTILISKVLSACPINGCLNHLFNLMKSHLLSFWVLILRISIKSDRQLLKESKYFLIYRQIMTWKDTALNLNTLKIFAKVTVFSLFISQLQIWIQKIWHSNFERPLKNFPLPFQNMK